LVITEPWASSTARETMFSEAISSICSLWRFSSSWMVANTAGSALSRDAEKNAAGDASAMGD
jgi:hypothetical protein